MGLSTLNASAGKSGNLKPGLGRIIGASSAIFRAPLKSVADAEIILCGIEMTDRWSTGEIRPQSGPLNHTFKVLAGWSQSDTSRSCAPFARRYS
jgi:hypothetical protein